MANDSVKGVDEQQRRNVQRQWAAWPVRDRLRVLARARIQMAEDPKRFVQTEGGLNNKSSLEVLSSEMLPLLAGMRFLEQSAEKILRTRRLGRKGRPLWLSGIDSEVRRVPFGTVLVIGPSNYPLFLPGIQAIQALAAGNAVIWKPGVGGRAVAETLAEIFAAAGLPEGLLTVTDDSVAAAQGAIEAGVNKVFLTGSAASGRALLHQLADKLVPAVVELSGCDAVIALPGANADAVVRAVTFGIRLNGSCTCMAPRRLLLVGASGTEKQQMQQKLLEAFRGIGPVALSPSTRERLATLLAEAKRAGAAVFGGADGERVAPVLVADGGPELAIAQEDIFAPVLTLLQVKDRAGVLAAQAQCPFGLTASIFGPEAASRALAADLEVGTVFLNDVVFPSADPRAPFGGRRLSGYGVTQGAEGLLEMAAIQTVSVQRSRKPMHHDPAHQEQAGLFPPLIRAVYGFGLRQRVRGFVEMIQEGRRIRQQPRGTDTVKG